MRKHQLEDHLKNHHADAYRWAVQCCGYQEEEAKEVLQQVYVKIIERKAIYKAKSSFKTWLFSVIRFTALDHAKAQRNHMSLEVVQVADSPKYEEPMDYRPMLERLPPQQQQVLLLAFYHDHTLAEIATIMDVHIGTVRTHYQRGKEGLRQLLTQTKQTKKA